jgi:hypothetical protein
MSNVQNMHDISPKAKYNMTTFDEVLVKTTSEFVDKAKKDGKPFFIWHNTTRMHVWTFLSPEYKALMNNKSNYGLEEAGMTQMDDSIGALLKHLDEIGEADNNPPRAPSWRAASGYRVSRAGRAISSRAQSRTDCFPDSIGFPPSSLPRAIPTSPTSC